MTCERPATDPYRLVARVYDRLVDPLNAGVRRVALRIDPPEGTWTVLDVGCGTGTGLAAYAAAGCAVAGLDASPAMLERAAARLGEDADLRLGDAAHLPYPDSSFDRVTLSMMLHEVPSEDRPAVLSEALRVTRARGRVMVIDFRHGSLRGWKGRAVKALSWTIERVGGHYAGYRSFAREGGLEAVAAAAGATLEREKIVAGGNLAVYLLTSSPT